MAIKKVRFNLYSSSINSYIILEQISFYTKIDGEWAKYNVGNRISDTETDNVLIESNKTFTVDLATKLFLASDFQASNDANDNYIDIIFKTPLDVMNQIVYCTSNGQYALARKLKQLGISVYDEDDVLIFNNDSATLSTTARVAITLATPELEYIKTYATNKISYIETTDTNQLKQVFGVNSIQITNKETEDETYCRFLFSFDGRQTYKTFDLENKVWVECAKEDIIDEGLSKNDIEETVYKYVSDGLGDSKTIDILTGMKTMNPIKTPSIQKITIDYLKNKDE